jgi:hypothetical protein
MGIDCVNINQTQEPNFNGFIDELLPSPFNENNIYSSFKFSIYGKNYLFYFVRRYDEVIQNYVVEAKLVDETSCYEDICSVVSSIDLTYVDSEILNALMPHLCNVVGDEQIYTFYSWGNRISFYDLQQVSSDEYLAVIKVINSLFRTINFFNTYILSSFDIYLIFRISPTSMTLERIEIPILEHAALGGCLPNSATDEQGFLKYKGNGLFLYTGISYASDSYLMPKLLMYSLDTQGGQKSILAQQQLSFSQNPSDYGISTLDPYTFQVNDYFLHAVYNSDDLFVLGTHLYFGFYNDTSWFGVEFEPLLLKVIKFSNQDGLTISDFYTPAFYSDLNILLTNLLNVSNEYVYHSDFIDGKFFKIGNKVVLVGAIDYLTIEDLPDIGITNVAMSHYTYFRTPATFVVYDFDEVNLKFVFNEIYFTGDSEDNNLDFYYVFFNSVLPIFEEKTTNPTTPYGVFLNASAKSDICQMIISKYSIDDCSQIEFYFAVNYVNNSYYHLLNAVQSFSDGCGLFMIAALRLLSSQSAFESSTNETPIDEYLAIVLFRFSFDEQGNLIKEYKILDVIKLYVVSPADTYVGRQESVYIPQIFFDNQKRLHHSVYVYRSLPNIGGGEAE